MFRPLKPETIARRSAERARERFERAVDGLARTRENAEHGPVGGFWREMYRDELARYAADGVEHELAALAEHVRQFPDAAAILDAGRSQ